MLKYLLLPFSLVYGLITALIVLFYKKKWFTTSSTEIFSIGIGNLTVGGTGKTPHIEYFIEKYKDERIIATLSRGYGRKTKGFITADSSMGPDIVGDEPWQYFLKYGNFVRINVGEKRAPAAEKIHRLYPEVDLLLLDDAFQHHAIKVDFSILLCDYNRPFFKDYPFPAGRLREFRQGAKRADAIIVSKCPAMISKEERTSFINQLRSYAPDIPISFSRFSYGKVVPVFDSSVTPSRWLLITGIAQPQPLIDHLESQQALLEHIQYPDHHYFSEAETQMVINTYQKLKDKNVGVLMTEKDYARLSPLTKELWKELPLFYIPIAVAFIEGEELLLQNIQLALVRKA